SLAMYPAGTFSETNDCPAQLAVGSNCHIQVLFQPGVAGWRGSTLNISTAAGYFYTYIEGLGFDIVVSLSRPSRPGRNLPGFSDIGALVPLAVNTAPPVPVSLTCVDPSGRARCWAEHSQLALSGSQQIRILAARTSSHSNASRRGIRLFIKAP